MVSDPGHWYLQLKHGLRCSAGPRKDQKHDDCNDQKDLPTKDITQLCPDNEEAYTVSAGVVEMQALDSVSY